jgi:hypothetical protein
MTTTISPIFKTTGPKEFEVTAGAVRVSDPCYSMTTWCAGTIDNVPNGKWIAQAGHTLDKLDLELIERGIVVQQRLLDTVEGRHTGDYSDLDEYAQKWIKDQMASLIKRMDKLNAQVEEAVKLAKADGTALTLEDAKKMMTETMSLMYRMELERAQESKAAYNGRVAYLMARHESMPLPDLTDLSNWEKSEIHVGVDSGQAGVFDLTRYAGALGIGDHDNKVQDNEYNKVCQLTLDEDDSWGTLPYGAVSSSGWGDGSYDCYFLRNEQGQPATLLIVYLTDYEEEEDESEGADEPEAVSA